MNANMTGSIKDSLKRQLVDKHHSVKATSARLITYGEIKNADGLFAIY